MKEIFLGHLATTLNKPVEEIAELLYQKGEDGKPSDDLVENAAELLKTWDVERVKTLRATADNKKALDDQYKRGKKEALSELEDEIRKAYKLESDKMGLDLIREAVATEAKSDLPEEKVKRHPLFLDLEKRLKDEVTSIQTQHKTQLEEVEKGYARKFTLADVKQRAMLELEKMNPVYQEHPEIAANYKRLFANEFDQYDYEKQEDGTYLVLKGEKRLEDEHGNPVGFDRLVKNVAGRFYTFKEQSPKGGAGNKNGSSAGDPPPTGVPKDENELWAKYSQTSDPAARKALLEAYEKEHGEIQT